jgi:cellulose synthase/poly-beta-1,6-N-acetylglucosamine synthase-like glycosyltransferase
VTIAESLLVLYLGLYGAYWALIVVAAFAPASRDPPPGGDDPGKRPTVALIIPAFNEAAHLDLIRRSLVAARSAGVRAVVVDDGSTDASGAGLRDICAATGAILERHPCNRGKAAALNTGLVRIDEDLVLTLDADTFVDFAAIPAVQARFSASDIAAVALTVGMQRGPWLTRVQSSEYRYVLNTERAALARFALVVTVPGAAAIWRRAALATIGGFSARTCAEDTDATISLQLVGWRVLVSTPTEAITEGPASMALLLRQRARWIWGTIQAAGYAVAALRTAQPKRGWRSAIFLVLMTVINVIGFVAVTSVAARLAVGDLTAIDVGAAVLLLAMTCLRIGLTGRLLGPFKQPVPVTVGHLLLAQMANAAGFWFGIANGRFMRKSWL